MTARRLRILAVLVALTGQAGLAGASEPRLDAALLGELIEDYVRSHADTPITAIEVPRLEPFVPADPGDFDISISTHPGQEMLGWVPLTLAVRSAGRLVHRGVVTVQVETERAVVVSRRSLPAGSVLGPEDLGVELRPASKLPGGWLSDPSQARGKRLRRSLQAGAPILSGHLKHVPDVQRGQRVKLHLRHGALRIDATGRALQDGRVGDWIRVRNLSSRREVHGRLDVDGAVHVEF